MAILRLLLLHLLLGALAAQRAADARDHGVLALPYYGPYADGLMTLVVSLPPV